MLTTISEQSQLLSPKKLLALQRQVPISDTQQQRQVFGTCIGRRSSSISEENNPINLKGFTSENSPSTSIKKRGSDECSVLATTNASNMDSNQLIDENCHREGHRSVFSGAASVGNNKMVEFLRKSLSIILLLGMMIYEMT